MYSNNLIVSNNINISSFNDLYTSTITKKAKRGYKIDNVISYPTNKTTILTIDKTLSKSTVIENSSIAYSCLWIPGLPLKIKIDQYYSNLNTSTYNTIIKNIIITEDGAAFIQGFGYTLSFTFDNIVNKILINGTVNIPKIIIRSIEIPQLSETDLKSTINSIKKSGTYVQYDSQILYEHLSTDTVESNIIKFKNKYLNLILDDRGMSIYSSDNGIDFSRVYKFNSEYKVGIIQTFTQENIISITVNIESNSDYDLQGYCVIYSTDGINWNNLTTPRVYSGSGLVLINNQLILYNSNKIYKYINNNFIEVGTLPYSAYNYYYNGSVLIMATSKYYYKSTDGINFSSLNIQSDSSYDTIANDNNNKNCWAITPYLGYTAISIDNGLTWTKTSSTVQAKRSYFNFIEGVLIETCSKGTLITTNYDINTRKLSSTVYSAFIKEGNILKLYKLSTSSNCTTSSYNLTDCTYSESSTISGKALSSSNMIYIVNNEWIVSKIGTLYNINNGVASKIYIRPISSIVRDFVKGYSKYVGLRGFYPYYSYDSFHWIKGTTSTKHKSLLYDTSGVFITGGASDNSSAGANYSTDGINWTHVSIDSKWLDIQITFNGKIFAIDKYIYYSNDKGKTWISTNIEISEPYYSTSPIRPIMTVINNTLYCPGGGYAKLYKTTDGITWNEITLPSNTGGVNGVYYLNNKLFICCSYGLWYSTNEGATWTETTLKPSNDKFYSLDKIIYTGTYYIASGINQLISTDSYTYDYGIWYSTDGINWEERTEFKNSMFPNSLLFVQDFQAYDNKVYLIIKGIMEESPTSSYNYDETMYCIFTPNNLTYTKCTYTDCSFLNKVNKLKPLNLEVT